MQVMVTGGAGYIGSVVVEELVDAGHGVVVLDDLSKGHVDAVPDGVPLARGQVDDISLVHGVLREHRIEAVVHLAASSLVGESVTKPSDYYRNNVVAGLGLLEGMRAAGCNRIVFSSTAAVYGDPATELPLDEEAPTAPTNPYGETKLAFERALGWFGRAYGLRHISLRYFNAAGASARSGERHDPETHLIPLLLAAAAGELPEVVVFGQDYPTRDGTCVRDYIHVIDLARAHVLALDALGAGEPKSHVYNLGCGGAGYTVREVIAAVHEVTGSEVPIRLGARRAGDPATLVASSARIARELGFRPRFQSLKAIVGSAYKWRAERRP